MERELSPSTKLAVRKTVAGGALNCARLSQQLPEATTWALDLYLLTKPLAKLLNCTDPEVTTVEEWKEKGRILSAKFAELSLRLKAMTD